MRETAAVSPAGTVSWKGTPYFASATRVGAPATLLIRKDTLEIIVADVERCSHDRRDGVGVVQRLPWQREHLLAAVHGRRKHATFRRQCLLDLGRAAWEFLAILVHRCPDGRWERPCTDLFDLLQAHGDQAMQRALGLCVARGAFDVADVRLALREAS